MNRLQTIDADTLQSTAYEPVSFVVDDLLPQDCTCWQARRKSANRGWRCGCVSAPRRANRSGRSPRAHAKCCTSVWRTAFSASKTASLISRRTHRPRCTSPSCPSSSTTLVEQIEQFLKEHPQTRLIVIDTLQRIRTADNDANPYASDYRDLSALKRIADAHGIAILLIHHLRKMNDDDPMNMISGTTGLSGATDSNFVLRKSKRRENTATLYCTGRDIPYRELALEFDGEDHVWKLLSDDCEQNEQPSERILFLLSELLRRQPEISAPASAVGKDRPCRCGGTDPQQLLPPNPQKR